jgi:putative SOS response-associated peptidase YedK
MCGRFKAGFEFRQVKVRWQIFNNLDFAPHYNIAPSAAVRVTGDE